MVCYYSPNTNGLSAPSSTRSFRLATLHARHLTSSSATGRPEGYRGNHRSDIIECNTGAARLAAYYEPSTSKSYAPPSACSVFEAHHLLRLASCTASHRQAQESYRETSARCVQAGARVASLYVTHAAPCCRITAVHGSNPPHVRVQPLNACTLRCLNVHSYMRHARNRPLP